jgi:hypothetical protein
MWRRPGASLVTPTEYDSVEDAKALRERLLASGVLDRFNVKTAPTIVEVAERETY